MREIKFRVWDKKGEEMILPNEDFEVFISMDNKAFAMVKNVDDSIGEVDRNNTVFMQYTGLTDVNGVEIYEGDIVSIKDFSFSNTHQPVELIRTVGTNYGAYVLSEKGMLDVPMTAVSTDNIEVIGNIFQDKDLLKEKN